MPRWCSIGARCIALGLLATAVALVGSHIVIPGADMWSVVRGDFRHVVLREPYATTIPRVLPLTRDYATLAHIWTISATAVWAGDFARGVSDMVPKLTAAGTLVPTRQLDFLSHLAAVNRRMTSPLIHCLLVTLAIMFVTGGLIGYHAGGVYAFLGPSQGRGEFARDFYAAWWARYPLPGAAAYFVVGAIGNYLNLWVTYLSIEVVLFFVRLRDAINLSVDANNRDGDWGWASVVTVIESGRKLAFAASVGLAALALIANPSSYYYFALFFLGFITVLLLFTAPNYFFAQARSAWLASPDDSAADPFVRGLQRAAVPRRLVPIKAFIYQSTLVALPAIIAVYSLMRDR